VNRINIEDALAGLLEYWSPVVVAELNGQEVRLAKLRGEFVWHQHAEEDELFLVIAGKLRVEFIGESVELAEGELLVVPKGTEHRPVALPEAHVLLFEPATTVPTGDEPRGAPDHGEDEEERTMLGADQDGPGQRGTACRSIAIVEG
jgi:mannose-6-phosphate isomerase-like protein (cupin superfamily)